MLLFWHNEGYTSTLIKFDLPKLSRKHLPVLTAEQLKQVIRSCDVREKALALFMADNGLRRAEVINLSWVDIDMQTGLVSVRQGKGSKDRSAVIGATTRRTLNAESLIVFPSRDGARFTGSGLLPIFQRLSKRTGIHIMPHALRWTFASLSLRNGMDILHLQNLGSWEDLETVQHYAQMVDEDLLQEHKAHCPIDTLAHAR